MSWRRLLMPFSLLYGAGVAIRNWFFDTMFLPVVQVSVPVVSVGNISAGGVGKTPLVQYLAERLKKRKKLGVISRGYGRHSRGYLVVSNGRQRCAESWKAGDEASQLAEKMDEVVVLVDEWRARAAQHAVADFGVEVILLDDGFQHRYLHRDLNIVVLTADEILNGGALLPAGNRREPLSSLARADLIGISRCDSAEQFDRALVRLGRFAGKPAFGFHTKTKEVKRASTKKVDGRTKKAIAFSGIGMPAAFEQTLASLGIHLMKHFTFRDHHWYSDADLRSIKESFHRLNADSILTTEKDIARLQGDSGRARSFLEENPVFYVEIELDVIAGLDVLEKKLQNI